MDRHRWQGGALLHGWMRRHYNRIATDEEIDRFIEIADTIPTDNDPETNEDIDQWISKIMEQVFKEQFPDNIP